MNYDQEIRNSMSQQLAAGVCCEKDFVGCSEEEIQEAERHLNVTLPAAYKSFLKLMGKGGGVLFLGTDHFYPDVMKFRGGYQEILRDENITTDLVPNESIIIGMHQGYIFYFIRDIGDSNPPVYVCDVTQNQCKRAADTFTKYILKYTEYFLDAAKRQRLANQ